MWYYNSCRVLSTGFNCNPHIGLGSWGVGFGALGCRVQPGCWVARDGNYDGIAWGMRKRLGGLIIRDHADFYSILPSEGFNSQSRAFGGSISRRGLVGCLEVRHV